MSGVPSTAVAFTMGSLSLCIPSLSPSSLSFRRSRSSRVFASRDGPELDKWDQMELNFGRLLGEDPKLTLAKVMARKANPDVSYLDIEKSFQNKKGKLNDYMIKISEDMNVERQPSVSSSRTSLSNPKTPNIQRVGNLNLSRPIMKRMAKTTRQDENFVLNEEKNQVPSNTNKADTSNISLRKPSAVHVDESDDIELDKYSRLEIKPNLFLKMRKGSTEKASDIPLLKKPEVMKMPSNPDLGLLATVDSVQSTSTNTRTPDNKVKLLNQSEASHDNFGVIDEVIEQNNLESVSADGTVDMKNDVQPSDYNSEWSVKPSLVDDGLDLGLQLPIKSGIEPRNDESSTMPMVQNIMNSGDAISRKTSLVEKPQRVESSVKKVSDSTGIQTVNLAADIDSFIPSEQEEHEDTDWKRAEHLLSTGERVEVELISYSGRGFIVSFGSLIGFLPYRNLGSKWKFLTFESWLKRKGLESLDPSIYRKNMIIMGSDVQHKNLSMDENNELSPKDEETFQVNTKFEEFTEAYDQEKTKFLSSFIGQKIWVSIVTADRISRRLLFSRRQKEKEEVAEKKRSLMVELSVGDVVKCCIKKITYFGIFVEVEGVPALIHQSEVSWDATLDPSSFFKINQIVEAKVHQLDYARERIALSLRETMPDPLMEALELVVGDSTSSVGNLKAVEADSEWADVESLLKELQQIDGVHNVSKGRFFLSPGLAPTFQVYMTSLFDSRYKLLARYGNKVQEVVVEASLDKERMKDAISTCTNRVA